MGAGGASTCGITSLELLGPSSGTGGAALEAALEDEDCATIDSATVAKLSFFNLTWYGAGLSPYLL